MVISPIELGRALALVCVAVGAGTVAHELAHAAVLRTLGVPTKIEWLPARDRGGLLRAGVTGTWASVRPLALPDGLSARGLRAAALVPLTLAAPFVLVAAGVVPDPFATDDIALQLALVGWLACGIPSPQDFSLFWHAETVLADPDEYLEPPA